MSLRRRFIRQHNPVTSLRYTRKSILGCPLIFGEKARGVNLNHGLDRERLEGCVNVHRARRELDIGSILVPHAGLVKGLLRRPGA